MKIRRCIAPLKAALVFSLLWYVQTLCDCPSNITLWQNSTHTVALARGVSLENLPAQVQQSGETLSSQYAGDYEAKLSLFGVPYKSVSINVVPQTSVAIGGNLVGIRLHSDGLIVTKLQAFADAQGHNASPCEAAGIAVGDVILSANGEKLRSSTQLVQAVQSSDSMELTLYRGGETKNVTVSPVKCAENGTRKLGAWVRDSTAGVGTLTYIDPVSGKYGALGHSISDVDTGIRFDVLRGTIEECSVLSLKRGERGAPGEIHGAFKSNSVKIGSIEKNTEHGIYGTFFEPKSASDVVPTALENQIKTGNATICSMLGETVEEYEIEILRISRHADSTRAILFRVTDKKLLERSGGIVQGMSGSPIMQNGRLIGAVTHVLVNEPDKGYGVLIETMLKESKGTVGE